MSVILGSEIARLVFGYLQDEQLDEAATTFCKTSPYLLEEYDWLRRGYKSYKLSDLCLVDIIREHCQIKYAVSQYIQSMSPQVAEGLRNQHSLSGKVESILNGLSIENQQTTSRKRTHSMMTANSTEATQTNQLPGYEPARKERRLSKKLILRRDWTPMNDSKMSSLKHKEPDDYASDNQDEETAANSEMCDIDKSRNETSQYPIFTETILENTQFQNVLVDNINRILENSTDRLDISEEGGSQANEASLSNFSLQEQVKHALDNIIMSTERDPTFQQVLEEVVQHTTFQGPNTRASSTPTPNDLENDESVDVPVPLKERLRGRSQDKPQPNYNENLKSVKKKRKPKVEVISNEIVKDAISNSTQPTQLQSTSRQDNYVPLNQILYLNSDRSMTSTTQFSQESVYVNLGVPPFPIIRIDTDTPMYISDIPMLTNGTSTTSLAPGSIINIPTIDTTLPIKSVNNLLPNVIIKHINEANQTKQIARLDKVTPKVTKNISQSKARSLSTPRRQSHVRALKFTSSEDLLAENDKRNTDNTKSSMLDRPIIKLGSSDLSNTETDRANLNTKSAEEEVEQQNSSDAVDFSKDFDEATVISVDNGITETPKREKSIEKKTPEVVSERKKPQTRKQSQQDLHKWNQMRQMNKGDWDNYLRQTVAMSSKTTQNNKKEKKNKNKKESKITSKSSNPNVSVESVDNATTDAEGKLLEEALKSAKKSDKGSATAEMVHAQNTKESSASEEQPKTNSSPVPSAQGSDAKSTSSPNKRSSVRKKLIQIKIPSAKKKFSKRRKVLAKATAKKPPKRASVTQIDPDQSIDIDFISPIEHAKEIQHPVKRNVNLSKYLETPYKDDASFKFPITPGFALPSSLKTPGVRLIKLDCDSSMIKFPEYPTPSFPITPGFTITPQSQSSSQKDGSCYTQPTDYSSGSSYYKPDESDDIDKNLDILIKENRIHENIGGLGVDPQQNITSNEQQPLEEEFNDSSNESTTSSSSSESSTSSSSSSSSSSNTPGIDATNQPHSSKDVGTVTTSTSQRAQHMLNLEQVRLRTMATLKSDRKIERFRKPKPKIHSLTFRRHKLIENALQTKKTTQPLKMSSNSTPKDATKPAPKHLTKTTIKSNPKQYVTTPSKRKIATPRRVIYLDYNEQMKSNIRSNTSDRKQRQAERASNENAVLDTVNRNEMSKRSMTPTESIAAIENHIAKTGQHSIEECLTKSVESNVDTPKLIQQLQDKCDTAEKLTTPEMVAPALTTNERKGDLLVRELFGAMSDSDFMDTPVKKCVSTDVSMEIKSMQKPSVNVVRAEDLNQINSVSVSSVVIDSDSESGDEYDDCTLVFSSCEHTSNRIHDTVVSKTNTIPIESNKLVPDLRPLKMFLDDNEITLKTCDEVVLFDASPKIDHPIRDESNSNKKLTTGNNRKTLKIRSDKDKVTTVQKVPKANSTPKETPPNSSVSEKNIKFNLIAKQKGPSSEVSSNVISSSSQLKRKTTLQSDGVKSKQQHNVHSSNQKDGSHQTKIPPLLKDMDINKVLGKIHPSNEN